MKSLENELSNSIKLDKCLSVGKLDLANSQDCYRTLQSFRSSNTYSQSMKLGSRTEYTDFSKANLQELNGILMLLFFETRKSYILIMNL